MPIRTRTSRMASVVVSVVVLVGVGCDEQSERVPAASDPVTANQAAPAAGDIDEFCAAVAALDQTDGTTDASVVLPAINELRGAAPAEIRDDVNLVSDTLIVNNYPSGVEPSMEAAPFEVLDHARARLGAYVEKHCEPGR